MSKRWQEKPAPFGDRADKFLVPPDAAERMGEKPKPPRLFGRVEASIGNGLEGYYVVEAPGDGSLVWSFVVGQRAEEEAFEPSAAAWERFWREVDRLDVWSWAESYEPEGVVMDGTYWSVALDQGDRRVRSSGANAYPEGDDPGRDFRALCRALSRLAGGRTFA